MSAKKKVEGQVSSAATVAGTTVLPSSTETTVVGSSSSPGDNSSVVTAPENQGEGSIRLLTSAATGGKVAAVAKDEFFSELGSEWSDEFLVLSGGERLRMRDVVTYQRRGSAIVFLLNTGDKLEHYPKPVGAVEESHIDACLARLDEMFGVRMI